MPLPGRMRRHDEAMRLIARDIFGLSLRPRALDVFAEDVTGIPHPILELERQVGIGPEKLMEGAKMGMQLLPLLGEL